jgi:curved DNA-binding protein
VRHGEIACPFPALQEFPVLETLCGTPQTGHLPQGRMVVCAFVESACQVKHPDTDNPRTDREQSLSSAMVDAVLMKRLGYFRQPLMQQNGRTEGLPGTATRRQPHEILGVPAGADPEEVRRAFRALAKRYHPDSGNSDPGAPAAFAAAKDAYDAMSGGKAVVAMRMRVEGHRYDPAAAAIVNGVGRLAAGLGMRAKGRIVRPRIRFQILLTLDEVVNGKEVELVYRGTSWIRRLASGIRSGQHLSGEVLHPDGLPHDYVLDVRIEAHPGFRTRGADVETTAVLSVYDTILGGTFEIPGLAGEKLSLTVPEGFRGGDRIGIPGWGLPTAPGSRSRGAMFVVVEPEMPGRLSAEERDLLNRLKSMRG